jgi:phage terminase large subunit-like protein
MARHDETAPDPAALLRLARQALSSAEYRKKFHMADFFGPQEFYAPQLRFFEAGAKYHQRLLRGGNQTGKSFSAAIETSFHLTGQYPSWWRGKRFTKPTRGWIIGPTAQLVRDGPQRQLCSKQGEFGTGTIPLSAFSGKPIMTPGGTQAIDTLSAAHQTNGKRDGISTATFESFEQKAEKLQSESIDWVWIDERCSEEIYSELTARTTATDGITYMSYTPLKGGGELTYRFINEYSADRCDIRIEASDAKHISPERRAQLEEAYLPHEREARIHGVPQLGIARVFQFPLEGLMRSIDPDTDIKSWARWIVGIDFRHSGATTGGHPFAAALCAWVHDIDEFFVVDGFRMHGGEPLYEIKRIAAMCRGLRIPWAYPHDANRVEKGSGQALATLYRQLGAPMLGKHATNHGTDHFFVEPAIEEMCSFMHRGTFYIANHMSELGEEFLAYHRDEDYKIVPLRDDIISAVRIAFMMRRSGKGLEACDDYGRAPGLPNPGMYDPRPPRRDKTTRGGLAKGIDFDLFG